MLLWNGKWKVLKVLAAAWPGAEAGVEGVVYDVPRAGAGGGAEAGVAAVQAGGPARAAAARGAGGVHAGPHLARV